MSEFSNALSVSASGMRAQAQRLQHLSENIANVDTPGYRRKTVPFRLSGDGVDVGAVHLSQSPLERVYDPGHPLADDTGFYEGSNVDLMTEVADAREAQRSYEANLRMFDQTRKMQASLMELLRR